MRKRWIIELTVVGICGLYFPRMVQADGPMGANEPQRVETMAMSPTQAAQAGGTQQAVVQAMGAVAAAMQPGANAAVPQDPAAVQAPAAQSPKPGVYDEKQMEKMIEEAKKNGKFIFVQISATWCGPCAKSIKDMQAMMDKYKDVAIYIVVEVGVTKEQMEAYAKKYKDTIFIGVPGEAPPNGFPAEGGYPTLYYFDGTKMVPMPAGVPDAATLKKWEEAMKKYQEEMKKKQEEAAAAGPS